MKEDIPEIGDDEIRIITSPFKDVSFHDPEKIEQFTSCQQSQICNFEDDDEADYGEYNDDELEDGGLENNSLLVVDGSSKPKRRNWLRWIIVIAIVLAAASASLFVFFSDDSDETHEYYDDIDSELVEEPEITIVDTVPAAKSPQHYVEVIDTIIDGNPIDIYIPRNATPQLHVGVDILEDTTATFVVPAADIRRDNGGIVGAYVLKGNLLSKGKSKAGFCAIIRGEIIIGVSDASHYLEEAIENDGYFFRQFPLVVGGQIVENENRQNSLRKALAEWNGRTVVVMTKKRVSFNEFSQILVDLGVKNAIYLVGSTSYGFAKRADGQRQDFGVKSSSPSQNSNYIVWY